MRRKPAGLPTRVRSLERRRSGRKNHQSSNASGHLIAGANILRHEPGLSQPSVTRPSTRNRAHVLPARTSAAGTRYDRLATNFLAAVCLAATVSF